LSLIVQKYGGSSLASPQRIREVTERIIRTKKEGKKLVVVVSAMGKTTDNLLKIALQLNSNPPERELDLLLSSGEVISSALVSISLSSFGEEAIAFTGSQIGIITDRLHTKAHIQEIEVKRIFEELDQGKIVIMAGFQGVTPENAITTLGRGGSDITAVAVAAALESDLCEIYTDVEGVYTADPLIIPQARKLKYISYEEMLELAGSGAKVIHSRAVEIASKYKVPLHIRSSFTEEEGTRIG